MMDSEELVKNHYLQGQFYVYQIIDQIPNKKINVLTPLYTECENHH